MTRQEAEQLIGWLMDNAARVKYGSITISVIRHGGETRLIEKSCTEKTQVQTVAANV